MEKSSLGDSNIKACRSKLVWNGGSILWPIVGLLGLLDSDPRYLLWTLKAPTFLNPVAPQVIQLKAFIECTQLKAIKYLSTKIMYIHKLLSDEIL